MKHVFIFAVTALLLASCSKESGTQFTTWRDFGNESFENKHHAFMRTRGEKDKVILINSNSIQVAGYFSHLDTSEHIKEYGFCWSQKQTLPTLNDTSIVVNYGMPSDTGRFEAVITRLQFDSKYYIRSYFITESDTGYNRQVLTASTGVPADFWYLSKDFPSPGRYGAASFTYDNSGYIFGGDDGSSLQKDLWRYGVDNSGNDTVWTQLGSIPSKARFRATAFVVKNKAYVGMGNSMQDDLQGAGARGDLQDMWQYDFLGNTWKQVADYPGGARNSAFSFVINDRAFVGCGSFGNQPTSAMYEYDATDDVWYKKANFPGGSRTGLIGTSIDGYGFAGLGVSVDLNTKDSTYQLDMWRYEPNADVAAPGVWQRLTDFKGEGRVNPIVQALTLKGGQIRIYVGTGANGTKMFNDMWEFNPLDGAQSPWKLKNSLPASKRYSASSFVIDNRIYVTLGYNKIASNNKLQDMWVYLP